MATGWQNYLRQIPDYAARNYFASEAIRSPPNARRSAADRDFSTVVPLPQYQRPEPPADLEPAVAEVWRSTVSSMRPDHFHRAMYPLLTLYCRSVVVGELLAAELRRRTVEDRDFGRFARMCNRQDAATLAPARSLRITPKSRRDPVDRRWEDRKRPWEL